MQIGSFTRIKSLLTPSENGTESEIDDIAATEYE